MRNRNHNTHHAEPSLLMADNQLSGIEYERRIREQDEDFQQALREAFWRGEFPGGSPVYLALPTRDAA